MSDSTEYRKGPAVLEEDESAAKRPCLIKGDYIGQVYELENDVTMIGRSGDKTYSKAEELIEASDRRLYEAKNAGRNCVRHDPLPDADLGANS